MVDRDICENWKICAHNIGITLFSWSASIIASRIKYILVDDFVTQIANKRCGWQNPPSRNIFACLILQPIQFSRTVTQHIPAV